MTDSSLSRERGGYSIGKAKLYRTDGALLNEAQLQLLLCPKCEHVLRDARQITTCGCRYCAPCIEREGSHSSSFTCLVDGTIYEKNDVRKDRGCQREIEALEVDCPAQPEPCAWRGKLTDMEWHLEEACPKRLVQCSQGCGQRHRVDELESHMTTECANRQLECKYCGEKCPLQSMKDHHIMSCQLAPSQCEYCQQVAESKQELSQHYEVCSKYFVSCPYSDCSFKSGKRDMNQHLMTSHIYRIVEESANTRDEVVVVKSENRALRSEVNKLSRQVDKLLQWNESRDAEIRELKTSINRLLAGDREYQIPRLGGDCVEVDSVIKRSEKRASGSTRDAGGLGRSPKTVQVMSTLSGENNFRVHRMSESILQLQTTVTEYGTLLEDLRLRQDILDVKTTHGILIWKIPEVRRRFREAVERKTVSLYSPPFYTSAHGYKVGIRLYLNGDGIGKGTHISLFFFVIRSEHDNLLNWPFKQSVRFTLIHQKKASLSITEAFVPDPSSQSFAKPESDMNIASGFPQFARQSVLQDKGFTQDNLIFVKCQVNLNGLQPM